MSTAPERVPGAGRSARCPRHGRVYDSCSEGGCPSCAAEARCLEAEPGTPPRRAGLLVAGIVALATAGAIHQGWISLPGRPASPAPEAGRAVGRVFASGDDPAVVPASLPAPGERHGGGSLDPAPFRGEIEAIEGVLYMPSPPEYGDPERVARLAMELGARMQAELGHLPGRRAFVALVGFAAEVEAQGEAGYAAPDLGGPRRAWESLRAGLFRPAAWFRRGGARLAAAQQKPEPRAEPGTLASLGAWADDLDALAAAGRREMLAFGEIYVDVAEGSREERTLTAAWHEFAREWDGRVTRACADAPGQPGFDGEMNVVMAWQSLGQAAHQLRVATVSPAEWSVPDEAWRQQSLAQAEGRIAEARAHLARARR